MTNFDDLIAAASPTVFEWHIHRQAGASWEVRFFTEVGEPPEPMDWTGCTASCQIRNRSGDLIFTFSSPSLSEDGWLTMTATPSQTTNVPPGDYVYDVDIVNSSARRLAFLAGSFRVGKQVTL